MATDKRIIIERVKIETFPITIEGETQLLCNKFSRKSKDIMLAAQMGKKNKKAPKDPQADYEGSIYTAKAGWYGLPAASIKQSCVGACRFLDNLPMTQARGAFFVLAQGLDAESGQQLVMLNGEPEIHEAIVRLGGRTADIRYRSAFFPWSITFEVKHNPNVITAEAIVNLVELAGFHQGIGDYRPEKNGTYGMFHVKAG